MGFKISKKKKNHFRAPASYSTGAATRGTAPAGVSGGRGRKKNRRTGLIVGLSVLVLVVIVLSISAYVIFREINGQRGVTADDVVVTIPEGASTAKVADILVEKGIITNSTIFKFYSRVKKADGTYQFGDHTLNGTLSYAQIIEVLQQTTIKEVQTVSFTFPEGTTALKMALMLQDAGLCTVQEFVDACNKDTYDVSFFSDISSDANKFIKLEGFLYPDTYSFEVGAPVHDMIQQMLQNFQDKVLTADNLALVQKSGMTLEQNIILASIVEKESLGDDVYARVASVFRNRLKNPAEFPSLESDTSTEHLPGNFIYGVLGYYYNGDTDYYVRNIPAAMVVAYDTYQTSGLIVGAICNPGSGAIKGTLQPEDTNYYFFITDDNKKFYWAATDAEHSANIQTVNEVNAKLAANSGTASTMSGSAAGTAGTSDGTAAGTTSNAA